MTARIEQSDLFGWKAPPQRKRPAYQDTSREAYRSMDSVTGEVDRDIVAAVRAAMPTGGLIDQEIEQATGRPHQTISANRRHLVKDGVLQWSGEYGLTSSGRRAKKWVIA